MAPSLLIVASRWRLAHELLLTAACVSYLSSLAPYISHIVSLLLVMQFLTDCVAAFKV